MKVEDRRLTIEDSRWNVADWRFEIEDLLVSMRARACEVLVLEQFAGGGWASECERFAQMKIIMATYPIDAQQDLLTVDIAADVGRLW